LELNAWQWMLAVAGAMLIGISKSGLPGVGVLAIPLFAGLIPARASTGFILPMLIVGDVIAVAYYHHHAVWRHLVRLFPWAVAGILAGWLALGRLNDAQIRPLIGGIVLVMLALNAWRTRRPDLDDVIPHAWWFAAVVGLLAGFTTMVANAAGPILFIYLLAMRLPKTAFLGTAAWYFCLLNAFKVPFSASLGLINAGSLRFNLLLAPAILLGSWLGIRFARRVPEKAFNRLVLILAAVAAVRLLF
jgi:uncharacterized protein